MKSSHLTPRRAVNILRAFLRIESGPAAVDFGGGQGGEACASPQRAVKAEPTPANAKRRAEGPLSILRQALAVILLAALGGLSGCLSRPALKEQTFVFNVPAAGAAKAAARQRVLGIRSLQIAAPFAGQALIYRTDEFSYVRDPYAEFLEPPADELVAPIREWLRGSGNFQGVAEAGSALKPDTLVEINVSQLFGDFRQLQHPLAVLTLHVTFFDAPNGVAAGVILQREYSRQIPLRAPGAADLMKGWDQALAEILNEITADLKSAQNHQPA